MNLDRAVISLLLYNVNISKKLINTPFFVFIVCMMFMFKNIFLSVLALMMQGVVHVAPSKMGVMTLA